MAPSNWYSYNYSIPGQSLQSIVLKIKVLGLPEMLTGAFESVRESRHHYT